MTDEMDADRDADAPALVRIERFVSRPDVVHIVIDNPPVNALSQAVRAQLLDAVAQIARDETVRAAVLVGARATFVAGSDIREFEGPIPEPSLPVVIAAIEECPKPVVAAIRGVALGGGFELALSCDARVGAANAQVGLPETSLGIIPGAGGTVKLPRLVGALAALDIICTGRRISAEEALRLKLFDEIAPSGDLEAAADRFALTAGKRRVRDERVASIDPEAFNAAAAPQLKKARAKNAVAAAIASVRRAIDQPYERALADERAAFQSLRTSEEAAALRHLFFAERRSGRVESEPDKLPAIRSAAVLGAGTMGAGITATFLAAGLPVLLIDSDEAALRAGVARIEAIINQATASGRIDAAEAQIRRSRLKTAASIAAASDVDIVVEAIFEDLTLKKEVFAALGRVVRPGAILASNTSYLDLDAIGAASTRPHDVVGLHFFSPAHIMRLLEIVRGRETSASVLAASVRLARNLGKLPVIARVGEGFIGNRIFAAYREQCELLLDEGATPADIDRAMTRFGFAMGPFAVWDLAGLDIAWRWRRQRNQAAAITEQPPTVLDELCARGRFGRKTGAGWYAYSADGKMPMPDPLVQDLVEAHARLTGRRRRSLNDEEIVARALAAIVNTGALVVQEGVASSVEDVDLVMTNGYGFPAYRGGPMFWASRQPKQELENALATVAAASGPAFRRADVETALVGLRRS